MVIYIVLNYANIDNFIVKENIKHININKEKDLRYISNLSLDANKAIEEGRKNGLITDEYYNRWRNKSVEQEHWFEYNYFNNKIVK